jgi:type II secretory pathway pseudopilin PulG
MNGEGSAAGISRAVAGWIIRWREMPSACSKGSRKGGFTYLSVLILVVISGIALTAASKYWSTIAKREKEKELLFRGDQIEKAIESYYQSAPAGSPQEFPQKLEDLLKDPRYLELHRYLRKVYRDPMTRDGVWGLVLASGGRIKGVFSKSEARPLKVGDFPTGYESFEKAGHYSDWKFVYNP